jgi:hypothetical protein
VHLALINELPQVSGTMDVNRLFQAGLTVTAADGATAVFLGHNDPDLMPAPSARDPEALRLALLHGRNRKYATGRQCAVDVDVAWGVDRPRAPSPTGWIAR